METEKKPILREINVNKEDCGPHGVLACCADDDMYNIRFYSSEKKSLARAKAMLLENIGNLDEILKIDVMCIFTEAFKNAQEHGNRFRKDKIICVETRKSAAEIKISIEDEGEGCKKQKNLLNANSNKVGFRIINSLADEVSFLLEGRKILFKKYLKSNGSPLASNRHITTQPDRGL